jgi:hypothetical protein
MNGYQIKYEYEQKNGKLATVYECTVYKTYKQADNVLSEELSKLERQGYAGVQGEVIEI